MWYDKFVKWKRDDGMLVLWDNHNPERWLSVNGEIYAFHFQFGRVCFQIEHKDLLTRRKRKAERKASASRHPANG